MVCQRSYSLQYNEYTVKSHSAHDEFLWQGAEEKKKKKTLRENIKQSRIVNKFNWNDKYNSNPLLNYFNRLNEMNFNSLITQLCSVFFVLICFLGITINRDWLFYQHINPLGSYNDETEFKMVLETSQAV